MTVNHLAVTDRRAAAMLDMSRDKFRDLVALGALPQPCRLGPEERWPVETLQRLLRGDLARPDEGIEI